MGISERSEKRRKKMTANMAADFKEAEDWDLDFWQKQTPQQRLSALVAIRNDILKVNQGRKNKSTKGNA
ncbi:Uncharacterized protein dnl_14020 [Desulfonema limicola]|uniref:Uncharacterized protein n=1 Tax=Desulfonema limicola TaxID=45656 RepID=A0A975B5F5_9BACT|nr:hypothetical protein [Desulfonema limicola]QTA79148.1 Uncharacterized protein dnl_14020 [Desulfonema limicola]